MVVDKSKLNAQRHYMNSPTHDDLHSSVPGIATGDYNTDSAWAKMSSWGSLCTCLGE